MVAEQSNDKDHGPGGTTPGHDAVDVIGERADDRISGSEVRIGERERRRKLRQCGRSEWQCRTKQETGLRNAESESKKYDNILLNRETVKMRNFFAIKSSENRKTINYHN